MSRPGGVQRRPALLAAAAATGVIGGHALDALGLLPGVHESAQVRAAALAPSYDVVTVTGAAALAVAAERLLRRRRPWLAAALLVAGQTALLAAPEMIAEATAAHAATGGSGESWPAVALAVWLQVVLAAGAVGAAVVIDTLLLRLPRFPVLVRRPPVAAPPARAPARPHGRVVGGVRGRGPPVPVCPGPTPLQENP